MTDSNETVGSLDVVVKALGLGGDRFKVGAPASQGEGPCFVIAAQPDFYVIDLVPDGEDGHLACATAIIGWEFGPANDLRAALTLRGRRDPHDPILMPNGVVRHETFHYESVEDFEQGLHICTCRTCAALMSN